MCAMMPMLRTLDRSVSTSSATEFSLASSYSVVAATSGPAAHRVAGAGSPAVVREGLVGFGHLVGVLAALDRRTEAIAGVENLVHQPLGHGLLAARPRVGDQPAQRQRGRTA